MDEKIDMAIYKFRAGNLENNPTRIIFNYLDWYEWRAHVVYWVPNDGLTCRGLKVIRTYDIEKGEVIVL